MKASVVALFLSAAAFVVAVPLADERAVLDPIFEPINGAIGDVETGLLDGGDLLFDQVDTTLHAVEEDIGDFTGR